ncbi:MAG: PEGA domain-containing protein [Bacteroidota bacterium]|nr:PEGA domain-containing protein [Bacteroidota bacterium]
MRGETNMKKLFAIVSLILSITICSCDKEESITQPSSTASIFVTSTPSGASITCDNVVTGKVTPDTIKGISEGEHIVKLALQNYADTVVSVTLIKDQVVTISAVLKSVYGSIFVTSTPSGASISLDNVATGKVTPYTLENIPEAIHSVTLTFQGYADTTMPITVTKNQVSNVSITLRVILSQYAGVWKGKTSQNLPVYFHITSSGIIDSISMGFRVSMAGSSCTYTTTSDSLLLIPGNSFSIPISGGMAYTTLRGTFSSASVVAGTTDDFSVNGLYCTGVFVIGTSVSQGSKTWQATKQ